MNKSLIYIVLFIFSANTALAKNQDIRCDHCRKIEMNAPSVNIFYKYFLLEKNIPNIKTFQDPDLRVQNTNVEILEITRSSIQEMDRQNKAEIWIRPDFGTGKIIVMSFHFIFSDNPGFYIFYQDLYTINGQAAGNINQLFIDELSKYGIVQHCDEILPKELDFKKYDDIPAWGFSGYFETSIFKPLLENKLRFFEDACLNKRLDEFGFENDIRKNFTPDQISKIGWYIFFDKIKLGGLDYLSTIDGEFRLKITLLDGHTFWTSISLKPQDTLGYFYLENEMSSYIQACIINEYLQTMNK